MQWLGLPGPGTWRYLSDYSDQLHQHAVEPINKGLAYVDELSWMNFANTAAPRAPGKNSPYRDRSVEENLALFEK